MRGLFLHQCSLDNIGGVESYYRRLMAALSKMEIKCDYHVVTPAVDQTPLKLLLKPAYIQKKITASLTKINTQYDFIITRHPYFTVAASNVFNDAPVVYIPPGNIPDTVSFNYRYGNYSMKEKAFAAFWNPFLRRAQNKALHCADFVNFFSESSRSWVDPGRYTEGKSIVNPPGCIVPAVLPTSRIVSQAVFIGRLIPAKNCCMMLKIARLNPETYFIIVGEGIEKNMLMEYRAEYSVENVIFASPDTAGKYIRESSILIIPSLRESFGHVIVEAFSNAIPVLGLRPDGKKIINANAELIPNTCGGLFDDEHEVKGLIEKFSSLSDSWRLNIKNHAINRFNMPSHCRKLVDMIRKTLD